MATYATYQPTTTSNPTYQGFGDLPRSTVPFKSSYSALHTGFLQFVWAVSFYIGSAYIFAFEFPWRVALFLSPHGFIKNTVFNISYTIYEWTLPLRNLTEGLVYGLLDFIDHMVNRGVRSAVHTHRSNVQHFKVAMEAYTRLIQEKAEIIERNGLRGIPMAMSPTKVAKAA